MCDTTRPDAGANALRVTVPLIGGVLFAALVAAAVMTPGAAQAQAPGGGMGAATPTLPRSTFPCVDTVGNTRPVADVFNTAFTEVHGVSAGDEFGASLGVADFNHDGFTDVAVGARGDVVGQGQGKGMAYVYLGSAAGIGTKPALVLEGEQAKGEYGRTMTAGDFNGDGYGDLVVGAHGTDAGKGTHQGRLFIYYGSASGLGATPSLVLTGENRGDEYGRTFDVVDMDRDGIQDLLVGASGHTGELSSQGKIYIHRGTKRGLDPQPWFTRAGDRADDEFGRSLAGADINGDGFMDLIVGAPGLTGAGKGARVTVPGSLFAFHGSAKGLSTVPSFSATAAVVGAHLGEGLAAVGDANGDGFADVAIGERDYSCAGGVAGKIILYLGSRTGFSADRTWSKVGRGFTGLGRSVARGADLDGDGYADFMTSAPSGAGKDGAGVHLFFGGAKGWSDPLLLTTETGSLGSSMAMGGDVNGEGAPDVVVGSAGGGPNREGIVRVYYGRAKATGTAARQTTPRGGATTTSAR